MTHNEHRQIPQRILPSDGTGDRRGDRSGGSRQQTPWHRIVLAFTAFSVVGAGGLFLRHSTIDFPVTYWANLHRTGLPGTITTAVYLGLRSSGAIILIVLATVLLAVGSRSLSRAGAFAATVLIIWMPVTLIKPLFGRPRPEPRELAHPFPLDLSDSSYISGHTVFVTVFALSLVVALRGTAARKWVVVPAVVAVALICVTVLVNGVHYPSDVAGSLVWVFGTFPLVFRWIRAVCRAGSRAHGRFR